MDTVFLFKRRRIFSECANHGNPNDDTRRQHRRNENQNLSYIFTWKYGALHTEFSFIAIIIIDGEVLKTGCH